MFFGLESSVLPLAGAGVLVIDYARRLTRIHRARGDDELRRDRAAGRVVILDFVDQAALDGVADYLLITDPPERLRRIELEHRTVEERDRSVSAAASPSARLSRRASRESRELYRGMAEPAARLDAVLVELEGRLPTLDRIVVTNERLVQAVHGAAVEDQREMSRRAGQDSPPLLHSPDEASLSRAVRVAATEALRDCSLLWLHGSFSVRHDGDDVVLEGLVEADTTWTRGFAVPVRTRVAIERLSSYGARLRPGVAVPVALLATAASIDGEPTCLEVAPIAIFTRSALHLPAQRSRLPAVFAALPFPLEALAFKLWLQFQRHEDEPRDLGPQRTARRALRGRGTPQWRLDHDD